MVHFKKISLLISTQFFGLTAAAVAESQYGPLSLHFEPNVGQADPRVRYFARAAGYQFFATDTETVLVFADTKRPAVRMKLAGSRPGQFEPMEKLTGISNYFLGNDPSKWRANVPQYARLKRREVYPAIDLVYYGNQQQIEYDFVVQPGADASAIVLTYEDVDHMRLDGNGDLVLTADGRDFRQKKPVVYQASSSGQRQQIDGSYRFVAGGKGVQFALGDYDRERPLVVDPAFAYVAYVHGSNAQDTALAIAVDSSGSAYITGKTASADFPTVSPAQPSIAGNQDVFITKLNPTGTAVVYSTFLGGSDIDYGQAIALDSASNAYVAGATYSMNFPVKSAAQATRPGPLSGFAAKLAANGTLVFATYLGGSGTASATGIAVDSSLNTYITGSSSADFPVVNAFQPPSNGLYNAFIAKLNSSGSAVLFSTRLPWATPAGIVLGLDGAVWIGGSAGPVFPTVNPIQQQYGGGASDAFLAKLTSSGSSLLFSTFWGGSGDDTGTGIALDGAGNILITGRTTFGNFPVISPAQASYTNLVNAFAAKLSPDPPGMLYSTYLSGTGATGIAADNAGNATVVGPFAIPVLGGLTVFPVIYGMNSGPVSISYATQLDAAGSTLLYSTFLADTNALSAKGLFNSKAVAVDNSGNAYVTGSGQGPFVAKVSSTPRCNVTIISVAPTSFPKSGGTGSVTIANPDGCTFPVQAPLDIAPWINPCRECAQTAGRTSGSFTFSVDANYFATARKGSLLINGTGVTISQDGPPFATLPLIGNWDTPVSTSNIAGVLAVAGWALSANPISVKIFRNALPGEQPAGGLILLGSGTFVAGSRPDVASQHPEYPSNNIAGWSYSLLTGVLPNSDGSPGKGNGTYQLTVILDDGVKQIVFPTRNIAVSNTNAAKPFGSIDTPGPGALISGSSYVNFGWALTPQPNLIPINGATINVFIDGKQSGPLASYNNFRGDIAAELPGYQNSNGAVGFAVLDTTSLTNGQHAIAWNVTDNANRSDTIGNRIFVVSNPAAPSQTATDARSFRRRSQARFEQLFAGHVQVRTGYDSNAAFETVIPDKTWSYEIAAEQLGRLELRLLDFDWNPVACDDAPLPVGATLDRETCTFYWQVDASFLGEHELEFSSGLGVVRARVVVRPQSSQPQ